MTNKNKFVYYFLYILSWLIFIGLSIEACGLLVNFFFHFYNPEIIPKLYNKLDLTDVYQKSSCVFYSIYSIVLFVVFLKAILFYLVIHLLHKLDLAKPFNSGTAKCISNVAYTTFSIGILGYIVKQVSKNLQHKGYNLSQLSEYWNDSDAFILMAAVIYIIAVIFKKGVELQNETDLTV